MHADPLVDQELFDYENEPAREDFMKTGCTHSCSLKATRAACPAGVNVRSHYERVDLVQMDKAVRRILRAQFLLCELHTHLPPSRELRRSDSEGSEARRVGGRATYTPRAGVQPENGQTARSDHPAVTPRPTGSRGRVGRSFRALHNLHRWHHKTRRARRWRGLVSLFPE